MLKVIPVTPEYETMANMWLAIDEDTGTGAIVDLGTFLGNAHKAFADTGVKLEYALLTHGHFDHMLGVAHAKEEIEGLKIAIHSGDEICLKSSDWNLMDTFNVDHKDFIPCDADIVLSDGDIIELGNTKLHVMHTPGHSAGSVCFIDYEDRIIFSGDTLFFSTVGRTDTKGGSAADMKESITRLLALEGDFDVYPGHGPATTLSHERVRNIYVRRMNRN